MLEIASSELGIRGTAGLPNLAASPSELSIRPDVEVARQQVLRAVDRAAGRARKSEGREVSFTESAVPICLEGNVIIRNLCDCLCCRFRFRRP